MTTKQRKLIRGAGGGSGGKGGGGGGATPVEASDSLHSKQYARVIDLISEGPIIGLVNGMQSVFLNDTPVQNADASYNFKDFAVNWTTGTQTQLTKTGLAAGSFGFTDSSAITAVSTQVSIVGGPVVRRIVTANIDQIIVTVYVPTLLSRDPANGNTNPTAVGITVDLQVNNAGYVNKITDTINGKTTSSCPSSA